MATVAPDADVLIAFLDDRDAQHEAAVELLGPHLGAGHQVVVGASVYAEVLVHPLRLGRAQEVDDFLDAARIRVIEIGRSIARRAARLRAEHRRLRLPDALSLACALESGATMLTFDARLQRLADVT